MDLRFANGDLRLDGARPSGACNRAPFSITNRKSQITNHGFTVIEILIVIALIVLVIALAIPAFSFITGSRSVDAGENLVSAMLSVARSEAVRSGRLTGVAFFRDQDTERTAMAIVVEAARRAGGSTEPAGMEQYKGWRQFQEDGVTPTQYNPGDVVVRLVPDLVVPSSSGTGNKKTTQVFVCTVAHPSTATSGPPGANWQQQTNTTEGTVAIDASAGFEMQLLPAGVGAQTINDPDPDRTFPAPPAGRDRYLRCGVILFDGTGALWSRRYKIMAPDATDTDASHLYVLMGFPQPPPYSVGAQPAYPIASQLGVVLYDEQMFINANSVHTQFDPLNEGGVYGQPTVASRPGVTFDEPAEEKWLDENAVSLMINRYNGTLMSGE